MMDNAFQPAGPARPFGEDAITKAFRKNPPAAM
jgi:hypothetical protein